MYLRSLLLCGLASSQMAAEPARVENFTLQDSAGKTYSLDGCKDKKAVVVVFLGTQCPVNNAFLPVLAELHQKYADQGVQLPLDQQDRQVALARLDRRPGIQVAAGRATEAEALVRRPA